MSTRPRRGASIGAPNRRRMTPGGDRHEVSQSTLLSDTISASAGRFHDIEVTLSRHSPNISRPADLRLTAPHNDL